MRLTPQEIVNQRFPVKFKGFDIDEVTAFLNQVAESAEAEFQEKEELKMKLEKMKETLQRLEKREDVLRDTLVAAQKFSAEIKGNAQREAELIIKEAEMKAEEIVGNAQRRQMEVREEIKNLVFRRREIEIDIVQLLESLKELIETYRKEDREYDKIEIISK